MPLSAKPGETPIDVKFSGVDRILSAFTGGLIGSPLKSLLQRASETAKREASRGSPGTVSRSWQAEVKPTSARVFSTQHPAKVNTLETGRRPGGKAPPLGPLTVWARRSGFTGPAFVLARAIRRRGLRGRFFMRKARTAVRRQFPQLKSRMGKQIESEFGKRARG